jgi:hypothetical protein
LEAVFLLLLRHLLALVLLLLYLFIAIGMI